MAMHRAGDWAHPYEIFMHRGTGLVVATVFALGALLTLAACSTPINVSRVSAETVDQELTAYALSADKPSTSTRIIMGRHNLLDKYDRSPKTALARLHQIYLGPVGTRDDAFTLAELSFLYAKGTANRTYYLASALYAYAFLFPDDEAEIPSAFDRRFRQACDLYNRALTEGLKTTDGREVELRGENYELPFGRLEVEFREDQLLWAGRQLEHFVPVAELQVEGLRNRYRIPGIGAPLAAAQRPIGEQRGFLVAPRLKVPATAVLRAKQVRQQLAQGIVHASLDLHVTLDSTSIQIGKRLVPLEIENTSFLAYTLAESPFWARELKGFFMGDLATRVEAAQLGGLEPYRPGRFPVVFVHGTASSPGRWADMVNDLLNDARIRTRFQFWFFTYNTGNPIVYSGMLFRNELEKAIAQIDPEHRDQAIQHMVVIGHSQGGLLTKLAAVETGDRLWNSFSNKPLDQMNDLPDEDKTLFRRAFFVHPVPSVRRVVFIATPHRGSFQATTWIGEFLARMVKLPGTLVTTMADIASKEQEALKLDTSKFSLGAGLGSGFGMRPDNPIMDELANITVAQGVTAHSIIAVQGTGPVEEGDDGVVKYRSAHIPGVLSEKVVRSSHSTQSNPETIEEVRRILLLHAADNCGRTVPCQDVLATTPERR
jgi:pimeloyl-ACP methyl ester carboxylesterase